MHTVMTILWKLQLSPEQHVRSMFKEAQHKRDTLFLFETVHKFAERPKTISGASLAMTLHRTATKCWHVQCDFGVRLRAKTEFHLKLFLAHNKQTVAQKLNSACISYLK